MRTVDLHMHSHWSLDGDFKVEELIEKCRAAGLKYVSLADHNSVAGVEAMINEGKKHKITVIPAIEIDCSYKDVNLHILGYNIDIQDHRFNELGYNLLKQECDIAEKRIKKIEDMGIYVNRDRVQSLQIDGVVTGEMIAEASLHEKENEGHPLLKPFLEGDTLADNPLVNFYWEYCAQGKPAYIPMALPSLEEIIALIHESGGLAVFAHPGHNIHENEAILQEIMGCGLDGIEAYSSYHSEEQTEFYSAYAAKYQSLITCGSDFHGKIKPAIQLGKLDYPSEAFAKVRASLNI